MYTETNYKTKKAIKDAISEGKQVRVYQPNDIFGNPKAKPDYSGPVNLEGPHYPEPHQWYATGQIQNGILISIK